MWPVNKLVTVTAVEGERVMCAVAAEFRNNIATEGLLSAPNLQILVLFI